MRYGVLSCGLGLNWCRATYGDANRTAAWRRPPPDTGTLEAYSEMTTWTIRTRRVS